MPLAQREFLGCLLDTYLALAPDCLPSFMMSPIDMFTGDAHLASTQHLPIQTFTRR